MTEKTDERDRQEAGGGRREPPATQTPPRSYSEFMRNLAAKYNTDSSPE